MKDLINHYLMFVFALLNYLLLAQEQEPVVISTLIGEKLDRIERDYFCLFPRIDGFQEAVFYLNPDSSLMVEIEILDAGNLRDTVISNYKSYYKMQLHFVNFIKYTIESIKEDEKGGTVEILKNDSSKTRGELMAVRDSSILVHNSDWEFPNETEEAPYSILNLDYDKFIKAEINNKTNIAPYIYPIAGMIVGGFIGAALAEEKQPKPPDGKLFEIKFDIPSEPIIGALIGGLLGAFLGVVLPIEIGSGDVFEAPFDEDDIEGLRDNSRHNKDIPYYLLKIK